MQRLLIGVVFLTLLTGCTETAQQSNSQVDVSKKDAVFFDPDATSVTLITENKFLVTLTKDTSIKDNPYMAWVAGLVERRGDTLWIDFPDDTSRLFRQIDCKYYFTDTSQHPPSLAFKQDLNSLFKTYLKVPCDSCGEMILHYGKTKAVVTGNMIRFL